MNLKIRKSLCGLAFCLFGILSLQAQNQYAIELTFVDHLKAGLIEQDVFVNKEGGSNKVYRVLPEEREQYLKSTLYKSKLSHKHDPFDKRKVGPFKKGENMGITLDQWLQAKGTAECTCEGGWGTIKASFENLMPNATYTMWQAFMAKDNTEDFIGTLDLPIGERDGSESVFKTDMKGNGQIELRFEHCLQLTDAQLMSLLAIAWHSDNKTYGIDPGPFGQATHIQLFAVLPDTDDLASKANNSDRE